MDGHKSPMKEDNFVFNHVGHNEDEARQLLAQFGRNELPDNSVPKWLVVNVSISIC
jgi:hypothetical protein